MRVECGRSVAWRRGVADLEDRIKRDLHGMCTLRKVLTRKFDKAEVFNINAEFHDECGQQLGLKSVSEDAQYPGKCD